MASDSHTLSARSHSDSHIGHGRSGHAYCDPDLKAIEDVVKRIVARREANVRAIASQSAADMSANNNHQNNNANNLFPSLEVRQAPSPTSSHAGGSQMNGNGLTNASYMPPLPAGHQQDLNYLYSQIQELSGILKSNRDKVNVITKTAEEVVKRSNGTQNGEENKESDEIDQVSTASRIHELELALAKANRTNELYKHEQVENTKLIAEYEDAMGTATEQIRNYCCDNSDRYLAQRRHYNSLLQAEKDEHLQSRLDRDHWHAQTMKVCGMIRHAYRLRCDEWSEELAIISGLQNEVRVYRNAMGMEKERPEDETGWPYLKDAPLNLEGINET